MSHDLAEVVGHAVQHVLRSLGGMSAECGAARDKAADEQWDEVTALVSYSGDHAGTVVLTLPEPTAARLVSAFAGVELDAGSDDFSDAIGELVNMIGGRAKAQLPGTNAMSVPTVILGARAGRPTGFDQPSRVLECACGAGGFRVEFTICRVGAGCPSAAVTGSAR